MRIKAVIPWLRTKQNQLSQIVSLPARQQVYLITTRPPLYRNISSESIQGAIVEMQSILVAKDYLAVASGTFDQATEDAVKRFQREHNLGDDGIVGALTWAALCYPELRRSDRPSSLEVQRAIVNLQELLALAGCYNRERDGYFGKATVRAVKRFQRTYGLHADGVVGPLTWSVLLGMRQHPSRVDRLLVGIYLSRSEVTSLLQELCIIAYIVLGIYFSPATTKELNVVDFGRAVTTAIALTCIIPFLPDRLFTKMPSDPRLFLLRYAHYVPLGIFSDSVLALLRQKLFS
ncbi:MAG: peptidoglycan-binding protein [Lyngbya sp. HA4199-MV5]|jgi:peptidoglycan hydrolase-like protein with peptidoglycan-binding domain|nr:peptidoglycan-binding protein [Lyngbya sp. HA4199-MV5]